MKPIPSRAQVGRSSRSVRPASVWRLTTAVVAAAAVTFPHAPSTRAEARCVPHWQVVTTPAADLRAVAALSSTNVLAVGDTGGADYHSVMAHWTGDRLTLTQGPKGHSLDGIAAVSPANVWAVGGDSHGRALIEHWNGARWRRLSTPPGVRWLSSIVMQSRSSGWAVGESSDERPLALRWNGRSWKKLILLRRPHGGQLRAVAGASAHEIWAVGYKGGEHMITTMDAFAVYWNGRRWRVVPAPTRDDSDIGYASNDEIDGVAVVSPREAWAIHSGTVRSDFQRWDGRRWRVVRVLPPGSLLADITAVSARNVWAVGPSSYSEREQRPLLAHWNGTSWKVQHLAAGQPRRSLMSVSALSASDIWAVGTNLLARYSCS